MKTGFTAFKLGIAAFIVPFIFIFEPALLLMGDWATILQAVFTAVLGVVCLAALLAGGGYWGWKEYQKRHPAKQEQTSDIAAPKVPAPSAK